ncbi:hypothetical protein L1I30_10905 [Gillisia sp. M10.2A]|uniref:Uncharacterized protein n=1 Tax=Gillisia lutea TaxID=2909668 RepID=A0ABS9EH97_9FLAO|nr:hypothetical protein [Gillisia lutea]MCF4102178.1 hypothetical protein [Gillisia lutea]
MSSVICTLFEGHYHYGVAALTNSLFHQGFKGEIFAGYRGELPQWAHSAKENKTLRFPNASTFAINNVIQLHFIPLETSYHLTNYKPDFMLKLIEGVTRDAESIYYFDPDIVVTTSWTFFEEWITYGVALCEDVNSPLSKNHPRRKAWRKYFGEKGLTLSYKDVGYANGGFVGLSINNKSFLESWKHIQVKMAPAVGGLSRSQFKEYAALPKEAQGAFAPFSRTDQDALNATIEAWNGDISLIGQEGMAFKSGEPLMPHALGPMKPWLLKPISRALKGSPPRLVDKEYWKYANNPIFSQPPKLIKTKLMAIKIAALLGRFYKRKEF